MTDLSQAELADRERAVNTDELGAPARRRAWHAGRDYGRERERALETQLTEIAQLALGVLESERAETDVDEWDESDHRCLLHNRAEDALAASQPEVLSERSDTEPGEPEGQPACKTCEDSGRVLVSDGPATTPCPQCRDMRERPRRPDDGVRGRSMSQVIADAREIERQIAQPDHGPGEPAFPGVLTMADRQDLCQREGHIPCADSPRCRRCHIRLGAQVGGEPIRGRMYVPGEYKGSCLSIAGREDRATEADIDEVVNWLTTFDVCAHVVTRDEARELLSLVFKEGAIDV